MPTRAPRLKQPLGVGDDSLEDSKGSDSLYGDAGDDHFDGGAGLDTAVFDANLLSQRKDITRGALTQSGGGGR